MECFLWAKTQWFLSYKENKDDRCKNGGSRFRLHGASTMGQTCTNESQEHIINVRFNQNCMKTKL